MPRENDPGSVCRILNSLWNLAKMEKRNFRFEEEKHDEDWKINNWVVEKTGRQNNNPDPHKESGKHVLEGEFEIFEKLVQNIQKEKSKGSEHLQAEGSLKGDSRKGRRK